MPTSVRPIHALLSQVLVAFTVEADNTFEQRMRHRGRAGARLSLVTWTSVLRCVGDDGITVRAARSSACSRSLRPVAT